jgi:ribosomal protein S24E
LTVELVGTNQLKIYHMENTKNKEELIEELEGILKANKDNMYCDEYQLADMIREALKLYEL